MFSDLIKLFFASLMGGAATIFNISTMSYIEDTFSMALCNIPFINVTPQMLENAPIFIGFVTAFFGFISAAFTCTYMYFQIKKIRRDLKLNKSNGTTN